jgi:hypothetical protein
MRAGLRWGVLVGVAGFALGTPALAQDAGEAATNSPAPETVGPRELQNFSLPGRVTRPAAEQAPPERAAPPPAERPAATARANPAPTSNSAPSAPPVRSAARDPQEPAGTQPTPVRTVRAAPTPAATPGFASVTMRLPPASGAPVAETAAAPTAASFGDQAEAAPALAPEQGLLLWPWLLAAMALGAGGAFLLWRNRARTSYAGGPQFDAFMAPEPAPRPRAPAPVPRAAPPAPPVEPASGGLVTTRLRPWMDLTFAPSRCIVEDQQVRFEFELSLFNSGSAAARDLLIEAVMINAGPTQEQEIATFFSRADGEGERIPSLAPLKRVDLRPQVGLPLSQLQVLEAGGRRVFVPLIAFNAHYRWGTGRIGRTSAVYLLGRETQGEKLAPFRLDLGPRIYRGIGARALPTAIRD